MPLGFQAVLQAAKDNDVAALEALVAHGESVNAANLVGQGGLHVSAIWGNTEVAKSLIQYKANVNLANQFGLTPLHYAAQNSRYAVARLLLDGGADINFMAQNGHRPYEVATEDDMRVLCGGSALLALYGRSAQKLPYGGVGGARAGRAAARRHARTRLPHARGHHLGEPAAL